MKLIKLGKVSWAIGLILLVYGCQSKPSTRIPLAPPSRDTLTKKPNVTSKTEERNTITYQIKNTKEWLLANKENSTHDIVFAVNRTDKANLSRFDSIVIPSDLSFELSEYLPFPKKVDYLTNVSKIVYFSYPTQTFAAYQNGVQVYSGATNMGREKHLTPTGLFFTNWKSKVTISTINAKWILKWNFNFSNKEGVGWHVYSLPGYPVSHACLRLTEKDAKFLYYWADQWVLANPYTVSIKGTPIIIFGAYDFKSPKPWLRLVNEPHALDITPEEIKQITEPYISAILPAQRRRDSFQLAQRIPQQLERQNRNLKTKKNKTVI